MKEPDSSHGSTQPLDDEGGYTSPYDRPVRYPVARPRRRKLRVAYWVVMLVLIGLLLWYIRTQLPLFEKALQG
jgi:hypothetical protein